MLFISDPDPPLDIEAQNREMIETDNVRTVVFIYFGFFLNVLLCFISNNCRVHVQTISRN